MEINSLLVACRSLLGRKKRQCRWEGQPKQSNDRKKYES